MSIEKPDDVNPLKASSDATSPIIEHDWVARITKNPDGTVTYEPTPKTLPDGSENHMATAMNHMRILMGER